MNRILQAFAVAYTAVAVLFATAALDQALDPSTTTTTRHLEM